MFFSLRSQRGRGDFVPLRGTCFAFGSLFAPSAYSKKEVFFSCCWSDFSSPPLAIRCLACSGDVREDVPHPPFFFLLHDPEQFSTPFLVFFLAPTEITLHFPLGICDACALLLDFAKKRADVPPFSTT